MRLLVPANDHPQPVQTTVARIAINLNLFQILSDSDGPLGTTDLARKTSADEVLLGRF